MIIYRGPSLLAPHDEIIAVVTGSDSPSDNPKTGPMLQVWILLWDVPPADAVKQGRDQAICGMCPMRGDGTGTNRACYVNLHWAPYAIWKQARLGRYPDLHGNPFRQRQFGAGQAIRLGAYGDPAAVPILVWDYLLERAKTWAGYTHQWRTCDPWLKRWCMASVDSSEERNEAQARGWRTFRTRPLGVPDVLAKNEITCPASDEAGKRTQCIRCRLCEGARKQAKSIAILPHGMGAGRANQITLF